MRNETCSRIVYSFTDIRDIKLRRSYYAVMFIASFQLPFCGIDHQYSSCGLSYAAKIGMFPRHKTYAHILHGDERVPLRALAHISKGAALCAIDVINIQFVPLIENILLDIVGSRSSAYPLQRIEFFIEQNLNPLRILCRLFATSSTPALFVPKLFNGSFVGAIFSRPRCGMTLSNAAYKMMSGVVYVSTNNGKYWEKA